VSVLCEEKKASALTTVEGKESSGFSSALWASYRVLAMLTKESKPFSVGEFVFATHSARHVLKKKRF
jgi:hypothetical protein